MMRVNSLAPMDTVTGLISELGGAPVLAPALDVGPSAISEMKRRGSIPVSYWPALIEIATKLRKELSYEALVNMHTKRPPAPAPAEREVAA